MYKIELLTKRNVNNTTNKMNQNSNYCKYCERQFNSKCAKDVHEPTCEFFFRTKREKDAEDDYIEKLPSAQKQFKLIQYLTLTIKRLEQDVARLKINAGTRKRKVVSDFLNSPINTKPHILFEQWYKNIRVEEVDLYSVFIGDINNGIMNVLKRYLKFNRDTPICSFKQKDNSIYIWTSQYNNNEFDTPSWVILDHNIYQKWIQDINHKLLGVFCKWKSDNEPLIQSSEMEKEKYIMYMHKIHGLDENNEKRRRSVLHKWIYNELARDIEFENEYV